MKRQARFISLALVACMMLLAFASCGGSPSEAPTAPAAAASEAAAAAEGATAADNAKGEDYGIVTAPGEFPVVKEPYTLSVFAARHPPTGDLATSEFTAWYEEKTGVHIEWTEVSLDALWEKLNLTLQSGDLPDVLMHSYITASMVSVYGGQGLFQPLNDYIDKYSVHLKEVMDESDYLRKGIVDPASGKIYALPRGEEAYEHTMPQKLWIYKPWLDALGLPMPTTTEEYRNTLIAFRDKDPNGNGKKDEIPLTASPSGWFGMIDAFLVEPFVYWDYNTMLEIVDGRVQFNGASDGYREAIKYLNGLYEEDLFSEEVFTQSADIMTQLGENPDIPILGSVPGAYMGVFSTVGAASDRYREYVPIPPLKGPDGDARTFTDAFDAEFCVVVTSKCANPEVAVRWADWFYTQEGTINGFYGLEGKGWVKPAANAVSYTGTPALFEIPKAAYESSISGSGQRQNFAWQWTSPAYLSRQVRESQFLSDEDLQTNIDAMMFKYTAEGYEPYKKQKDLLPGMFFSEEDAARLAEITPAITGHVRTNTAEMAIGRKDVDASWPEHVAELDAMGVKDYVDIYQKAYDDYNK